MSNLPNQRHKKHMRINTTQKKRIIVRNSSMKRKLRIIQKTMERSKFMLMLIQMDKSNSTTNKRRIAKRMENSILKAKKKMSISNTRRLSTTIIAVILMVKPKQA